MGEAVAFFDVHGRGLAAVVGELGWGAAGEPGCIFMLGVWGEAVGGVFGEAFGAGEGGGAVAGEHDVVGGIHDAAGDLGGVGEAAEEADGAAAVGVGHDGGVEAEEAGGIGEAADADGIDGGVELDGGGAGDGGVKGVAVVSEDGPGGGVGGGAEGPGGEDEGRGGGRGHILSVWTSGAMPIDSGLGGECRGFSAGGGCGAVGGRKQ